MKRLIFRCMLECELRFLPTMRKCPTKHTGRVISRKLPINSSFFLPDSGFTKTLCECNISPFSGRVDSDPLAWTRFYWELVLKKILAFASVSLGSNEAVVQQCGVSLDCFCQHVITQLHICFRWSQQPLSTYSAITRHAFIHHRVANANLALCM